MKSKNLIPILLSLIFIGCMIKKKTVPTIYQEQLRPQFHFSPPAHWMNDPNGMVYYKGIYHLFYQYYPDSTVWGPMHWGHATSQDLVHWKNQPIALYPDSFGLIFSGSAVVDKNNTSGFGKDGKRPLVAIFTQHNLKGEKEGRNDYQNQSIAYSLDDGMTWTKYVDNPVLKNPGIRDFRDPKISWYELDKKWIMTLATSNCVTFYSSPNLKTWTRESDFGKNLGAHGGVWECPDLFPLNYEGKKMWVLLSSINPGGPNGGSATQYFIGNFDGKSFTPLDNDTHWIDYGTDNYAGVTWSNTGDRKIFLGWMSNWQYANVVPTKKWRSAMTIPRELKLEKADGKFYLASTPVVELNALTLKAKEISLKQSIDVSYNKQYVLKMDISQLDNFTIVLSNDSNEELKIGYKKEDNQFFIDRTRAGISDFSSVFPKIIFASRMTNSSATKIQLWFDTASVELFADDGLTTMTSIFFPKSPYKTVNFKSAYDFKLKSVEIIPLTSIWHP